MYFFLLFVVVVKHIAFVCSKIGVLTYVKLIKYVISLLNNLCNLVTDDFNIILICVYMCQNCKYAPYMVCYIRSQKKPVTVELP